MARPALFVLAGVNGAGKSSIGGHLLQQAGLIWFNPDTFARELMAATACAQSEANAAAWQEGLRRFDAAIKQGRNHAFETTLGGRTMPARIKTATRSHEVMLWFCGLSSPELHMARVQARVAAGGHDIAVSKIRERYPLALGNLIALMPDVAHLQVWDNSTEVARGKAIPDPVRVLEMEAGRLLWPTDVGSLRRTPEWAKPLLEAALSLRD